MKLKDLITINNSEPKLIRKYEDFVIGNSLSGKNKSRKKEKSKKKKRIKTLKQFHNKNYPSNNSNNSIDYRNPITLKDFNTDRYYGQPFSTSSGSLKNIPNIESQD